MNRQPLICPICQWEHQYGGNMINHLLYTHKSHEVATSYVIDVLSKEREGKEKENKIVWTRCTRCYLPINEDIAIIGGHTGQFHKECANKFMEENKKEKKLIDDPPDKQIGDNKFGYDTLVHLQGF